MQTALQASPSRMQPTDGELLARFVEAGDQAAFRALVERSSPLVWHVCRRVLGRRQDAEDALQATFLLLARKAETIRRAESVGSWLYGVAYRTSLSIRRRGQRRRETAIDGEIAAATADARASAEYETSERALLHEELNRMPARYREPLILRYLLGEPSRQVCAALGVSPTVLKGRLQRGRHELRTRLALRGVGLSMAAVVLEIVRSATEARAAAGSVATAALSVGGGHARRLHNLRASLNIARTKGTVMRATLNVLSVAGCVAAVSLGFPQRSTGVPAAAEGGLPTVVALAGGAPPAAPAAPASTVLKYGDDQPDGKKSIAGTGEMIRFTAPQEGTKLSAIEVHGARYGYPQAPKEDFKIYILSEDREKVLHTELMPYGSFERGESQWVKLKMPKPVAVPRTFWVVLAFNAEATKGVYVSYDASTGGEHSMVGLPGTEATKTKFGGDWMIRAELEK